MAVGSAQHTERLSRNNAVLLLVDHQVGLYTGIRDIDIIQLDAPRIWSGQADGHVEGRRFAGAV